MKVLKKQRKYWENLNSYVDLRRSPRLKKRLGQFLLQDEDAAQRISDAIPGDHLIVEIGPGDGALTAQLLASKERVIGCELDEEMVRRLSQRFEHRRNFRIIRGDILNLDWQSVGEKDDNIYITGNLPYHLASTILFNVFDMIRNEADCRIKGMVIMVQKEVGLRIAASPGKKDYSALTLLRQYHAHAEYLFTVLKESFRPVPKVDGAVIKLTFHAKDQMPVVPYQKFRRIVKSCFAQRRKMMRNSLQILSDLPVGWQELNYNFTLRPENFTFEDFIRLTQDIDDLRKNEVNANV